MWKNKRNSYATFAFWLHSSSSKRRKETPEVLGQCRGRRRFWPTPNLRFWSDTSGLSCRIPRCQCHRTGRGGWHFRTSGLIFWRPCPRDTSNLVQVYRGCWSDDGKWRLRSGRDTTGQAWILGLRVTKHRCLEHYGVHCAWFLTVFTQIVICIIPTLLDWPWVLDRLSSWRKQIQWVEWITSPEDGTTMLGIK